MAWPAPDPRTEWTDSNWCDVTAVGEPFKTWMCAATGQTVTAPIFVGPVRITVGALDPKVAAEAAYESLRRRRF